MKQYLILGAILLVLVSTVANERYIGNSKHPDYPDKCYYEPTKHTVAKGEDYLPVNVGECMKITCEDQFALRIETCSRYTAKPECVKSADYTKPYPDCCPIITPNC